MERVSIIIPALREPELAHRTATFRDVPGVEVIAVLAEGDSSTPEPPDAIIVRAPEGRARQMNAGARAASGDILLFLHADTRVAPESLDRVRALLRSPGVALGAYRLAFRERSAWLRLIALGANLRARLFSLPYGDQALFMRRADFTAAGGFSNEPILEDVLLVQKMRRRGTVALLEDYAVTSARRWMARGMLTATLRNWAIMALFALGASPGQLARWFRR